MKHFEPTTQRPCGPGRPQWAWLAVFMLFLTVYGGLVRPLHAQFGAFGKNKVQYNNFEWKVLSGPRVDVFFYPEEETIARAALSYAEESFDTLVTLFRHRPFRRVPLIIYSSHQHFEQTNVTPGFLPEGVAGFTEFLKRRIALPYNGNYTDFRHTIRHELVHFFQLSKLSRLASQYPRGRGGGLPLWWSEGLAERWSSEQDADDAMFVRDMVLSGRLPSIEALTFDRSFAAYPLGGEIHKYLGERFGYGRVADLYEALWKYSSFGEAFAGVYGVPLQKVSQEFRYEMERRYFRDYEDRKPVNLEARPLVRDLPSFKPTVHRTPEGIDEVYFMSPGSGYTTVYRVSVGTRDARPQKVLQGDQSEQFESLHFFNSRLDLSPSGKLVLASKYLGQDAIFIWDQQRQKIVGRYQFPDLVAIGSPSWSPGGDKVVFSALATSGLSDLYVLDFTTQERYPITQDHYEETDPDWSPDGRYIVFSSDRTALGRSGHSNLFLHDLETGATTHLTYGPWQDFDPRWSPDGELIVFTSSRNGIYDLFVVDREGRGGRLSGFTGAVFDADWLPDGDALVFSAYERGTFNIYYKALTIADNNPGFELVETFELPDGPPEPGWAWEELDAPALAGASISSYKPKFALDFAAGQAAVAGFGAAGGLQFVATDMLGDHLIFASLAAFQSEDVGDALSSLSGRLQYINLSQRVNWGVGIFRFKGRFVDASLRNAYEENTYGGLFTASYPFSKFRRIELLTTLENSDREDAFFVGRFNNFDQSFDSISFTRKGVISRTFLSYVSDNTLWLPTGPIDGMRWNLTGGLVTDLTQARAENFNIAFDLRRYFRTSLLTAYAVRLFAFWSDGAIPQRVPLGGSLSLRLYPYLGFFGSRIWMLNQEWRFPLTRALAIAFPFGVMRFPGVQGGLFVDLAQVSRENFEPEGVWGSYGLSLRMPLIPPFNFRLDMGKRFKIGDLNTTSFRDFYEFETDFFIGFNY